MSIFGPFTCLLKWACTVVPVTCPYTPLISQFKNLLEKLFFDFYILKIIILRHSLSLQIGHSYQDTIMFVIVALNFPIRICTMRPVITCIPVWYPLH